VPYRLHVLPEAMRVFIPEDCDTLVALRLTATCNHGGARKWRSEHTHASWRQRCQPNDLVEVRR
jgi:hypothetical protein